jgi:hypothetical protein
MTRMVPGATLILAKRSPTRTMPSTSSPKGHRKTSRLHRKPEIGAKFRPERSTVSRFGYRFGSAAVPTVVGPPALLLGTS